jgi:hypothetical protein
VKKVTIQEGAAKKVPSPTVNSHVYAAFRVLTLNAEGAGKRGTSGRPEPALENRGKVD